MSHQVAINRELVDHSSLSLALVYNVILDVCDFILIIKSVSWPNARGMEETKNTMMINTDF